MTVTATAATTRATRRRHAWIITPLLLTAALLAARAAAVPPLSDPVHGAVPAGLHLAAPWLYIVLAPLFTAWDGLSMLGMSRLRGFLTGCAALYVLWRLARGLLRGTSWRRELASLGLALALFFTFVAAGMLWHRPMLMLAGVGSDHVAVDYHGHTNVSRDVRETPLRNFDLEARRRWHGRAGFDALFVTDHNAIHEPALGDRGPPHVCPGTEVSGWGAHTILLGLTAPIHRPDYGTEPDGLPAMIRDTDSAYGALSIASLPEYEHAHWHRLERLIDAGLDGFEIVNASPKANELSSARRDTVIALARREGRLVVGVNDSHGWGATSMVWNLVRIPGWRENGRPVCAALLARLRQGFSANRIIERHRLRTGDWWPVWLTPVGALWETWRSMGWTLTGSWLIWIWLVYLSALYLRNRHASRSHPRHRLRRP